MFLALTSARVSSVSSSDISSWFWWESTSCVLELHICSWKLDWLTCLIVLQLPVLQDMSHFWRVSYVSVSSTFWALATESSSYSCCLLEGGLTFHNDLDKYWRTRMIRRVTVIALLIYMLELSLGSFFLSGKAAKINLQDKPPDKTRKTWDPCLRLYRWHQTPKNSWKVLEGFISSSLLKSLFIF